MVTTADRPRADGPVTRVPMRKFGALRCGGRKGHDYRLMAYRGRLYVKCANCPAESEGIEVYQPLKGGN